MNEKARASAALESAIAAMSDGFVLWDAEDRLVTCNERYRELYQASAPLLVKGAKFEDIIRRGVELGQYPEAEGQADEFTRKTVAWHRSGTGSMERLLPGGRWLLITERPMPDGRIVGIRTDITPLKRALAEVEFASGQAHLAAEETRRQNEALQERDRALDHLAHHDDLTGLPNRALFRKQLEAVLHDHSSRDGVALLYLDLDRFKDVNDTLGHPVGDELLRIVARRLLDVCGSSHPVCRLGGDEFAVIFTAPKLAEAAEELSNRLVAECRAPASVDGRPVSVGASIGIAFANGQDADGLLKAADLALYQAKALGRGAHCVFTPNMATELQARVALEQDLRRALDHEQFEIAYQPIYDLASGRPSGFEALLRWFHPDRGHVSPGEFIPAAEKAGLIPEIGSFVIRRACADIAPLPEHLRIAINLSPLQIVSGSVVELIAGVLQETGLAPPRLELEVTETAFAGNDQSVADNLASLRQLGAQIVLDDFGTGYSSLSHLRNYPLSKIKIDQSFVREMGTRSDCAAIVSTVVELAGRLGMSTTAEGVETEEQLELVRRAGCTQAQGYLLGRPQAILAAVASLTRSDPRPQPLGPTKVRFSARP